MHCLQFTLIALYPLVLCLKIVVTMCWPISNLAKQIPALTKRASDADYALMVSYINTYYPHPHPDIIHNRQLSCEILIWMV